MNSPLPPDPYKALGVETTADATTIKTAYRKLVLKCHPDKFPDPTLKALKQEEFHKIQQAYEILGNEDRKEEYDLEVQSKKLKDELSKRGGSTANGPSGSRYYNVNVRTAEPPPGWAPSSKHSPPKSSSHKPYSGLFSQSWENEIPSRSKAHYDEARTTRRAASYEKPKREDSRERRRRFDEDRERDRGRREQDEEDLKRERRQKLAKERELRERELKERERERERERVRKAREREEREARVREHEREARQKEQAKAEKKIREREREASKRKQELDEKTRAKAKPYVETGFSEDEEPRRSPLKKPVKKHDSPTREKPPSKQRERLGSRDETPVGGNGSADDKFQSAMAFAAQYVQETKNKASKSPPKVAPEMPAYSNPAYPDPHEKFAAAAKRRGSGDAKHAKGDPVILDVPGPSKERPETVNASPAQQGPPRLQKSYTSPYMPQAQQAAPAMPPRGHPTLTRSYTLQPDHLDGAGGRSSGEKHRSSRRRASFDEDNDHFEDRNPYPSRVRKYSVNKGGAAPRTMENKYKDYAPSPGATFPKVKTAPNYGPEHVATSKRYGNEEVMTTDYSQPSYSEYPTQATAH